MRQAFALIIVAALISGCGSGALEELAKDTCDELDGAIVLQIGPILSKAIGDAEEIGAGGPELGAAMREVCPGTMAAIEGIGDEQERKDALPDQMAVEVTSCSQDEALGTVTNNSASTVDVFLSVQWLDEAGTVIDDGIGSVSGLRPGETGRWDSSRFGEGRVDRCRADVDSAYEQ